MRALKPINIDPEYFNILGLDKTRGDRHISEETINTVRKNVNECFAEMVPMLESIFQKPMSKPIGIDICNKPEFAGYDGRAFPKTNNVIIGVYDWEKLPLIYNYLLVAHELTHLAAGLTLSRKTLLDTLVDESTANFVGTYISLKLSKKKEQQFNGVIKEEMVQNMLLYLMYTNTYHYKEPKAWWMSSSMINENIRYLAESKSGIAHKARYLRSISETHSETYNLDTGCDNKLMGRTPKLDIPNYLLVGSSMPLVAASMCAEALLPATPDLKEADIGKAANLMADINKILTAVKRIDVGKFVHDNIVPFRLMPQKRE